MRIAIRVQDISALEAAINALTGVERTKAEAARRPSSTPRPSSASDLIIARGMRRH
jgi:hypothetical protein